MQTANQISTTLKTEYQTKADADKIYATQSSLKATSDSITASVSKTYATKDALTALQNASDSAIESWRGTGAPTLENKPASDWTTDAERKKHSGDLYYDKATGKAYRFGSDDGETYTWELNQDTDVTKALADASKAQTSANNAQASATAANTAAGKAQSTANTAVSNAATAKNAADAAQSSANKAQSDVDKLKIDIPETYATKSSLTQTAESITANVESVRTTANSAVTAASKAQQTADGISANLSKNYQTKSQADTIYATKASLKATSESISTEVTKAQGTADGAVTAASKAQQTADAVTLNLSKNYQTKAQNDAVYATQTSLKATSDSLSASITANARTAQSAVDKATSLEANLNGFKTTVAETYQTKSGMSAYATNSSLTQTANSIKAQVTEVSKTANGAMSKATTVEQTANGLSSKITEQGKTLNATVKTANEAKSTADSNKTTISQVSTTASNALSKASTVEQNLNGFKTSVSQTYGRGSNLWVNPTFDADKPQITSRVNNVTAPNGSGVNLLASRDHYNSATSFPVVPGHTYVVTAHVKRLEGDLPLTAGIWYTAQTGGTCWDSITSCESTSSLSDGWMAATWRFTCPDGKSRGCVLFHLEQWKSSTQWYVANVVCVDVTGLQPSGDYATNSSLSQTANSIKAQVSEVAKTASGAMNKASSVEQTASGLSTKITEQAKTLDATVKTANEAKSTADSNKRTISQVASTADGAVSRVSSLEQNINGFKTSVAKTYQTKGDYPTKAEVQSRIDQSASSIKSTVGQTYTTLDATEALRKSATRMFTLYGASGSPKWVKLGYLTSNGDSSSVLLHVYSGDGYNGAARQNAEFEIFVKDGWRSSASASGAFGVSVNRIRNADDVKVKVMAFSATACDIWAYLPWAWWNGHYTLQGDYRSWNDGPNCSGERILDSEPTNGVAQDLAYDTLSTRSYVDQTSKSVALGVMQNYRGADGSGLATKSDITATANSIKAQVSEVAKTASGAMNKASSVEQTASGLSTKITEQAKTLDATVKTANEAKSTADSNKRTISQVASTADGAVSRVSSLEQNINGFKTSVAKTYQTKGDYPTKAEVQSRIDQSASSIKSTVGQTYTTLDATEALRKSATRMFTLYGASGSPKWVKLGYLTSNGDSSSVLLHVYSGDGYNGAARQNAEFEIFVKDGWRSSASASGAFGVSVNRIRNADDVKVKVMAFSATACDIWAYLPWAWWNGHYTLQGDYRSWNDGPNCSGERILDSEPTNGVAQDLAYDTLSTRSYVDQTSKSVALGVMQNYRGADGSGLATKSDITATANSITSTVSSTYATKSGVTQEISSKITQNNKSLDVRFATKAENQTARDAANTAKSDASDARSRVGALEDCISLTSDGVQVGKRSNGVFTGPSALVGTDGAFHVRSHASTGAVEDVVKLGHDLLAIKSTLKLSDGSHLDRLTAGPYGDSHFALRMNTAGAVFNNHESVQIWQTGWQTITTGNGCEGYASYGYRGGCLRFRGRVRTTVNGDNSLFADPDLLDLATTPVNRNFLLPAYRNGTLGWTNTYVPANTKQVKIYGVWDWVSLDQLSIAQ